MRCNYINLIRKNGSTVIDSEKKNVGTEKQEALALYKQFLNVQLLNAGNTDLHVFPIRYDISALEKWNSYAQIDKRKTQISQNLLKIVTYSR